MTGVIPCDKKSWRPCLGMCFVASNSLVVLARSLPLSIYRNVWDIEQMTCHGSRGPLTADVRLRFNDSPCGVCVGQNWAVVCVFSEYPVVPSLHPPTNILCPFFHLPPTIQYNICSCQRRLITHLYTRNLYKNARHVCTKTARFSE